MNKYFVKFFRPAELAWLPLAGWALFRILAPGPALAGAWTQPRGHYYLKIEAAGLSTNQVFNADGHRVDYISALSPGTFKERQIRAYAEYGLAPRLTLVGATAYQSLEVREEGANWKTWGLSDIRIGARFGLPTRDIVSALALEVKIPPGYEKRDFPSLGSGDPDASLNFLLGRSLGPVYLTGDVGYNLRGGPLENELMWSAEAGWSATTRIALRTGLRARSALTGNEGGNLLDPTQVNSQSLKLAGTLVVKASRRFDIEVSANHTLSGQQTLAGTEAGLALAWHQ
ncbi:MAG: hypothetical protein SGI90_00910 [Candidatus Eisenbacteria bacterium]|nr:hypothetical protein [Candidatus Eisenbacteria bacterium]